MRLTRYHAKFFAHDLTRWATRGLDRLSMSVFGAAVDVNSLRLLEEDFARLISEAEGT